MKRFVMMLLLVAMLPLSVPGTSAQDTVVAGYITWNDSMPYFVKMKEGIQSAADAAGIELMTAVTFQQAQAIDEMIAAGASGILIVPADAAGIVPAVQKARDAGVVVIALDSPTSPEDATDALIATDNFAAGYLIGQYARAALGTGPAKIATLDVGVPVGVQRHNGFLAGFNSDLGATPVPMPAADATDFTPDEQVVCAIDYAGDERGGQSGMNACLQQAPDVNVVFTINEPTALGAYEALKAAGRENDVILVSIDGGREGVQAVKDGMIAATAQQYPVKMGQLGIEAIVHFAETGEKPSGFIDSGVTLITDQPVEGVPSQDTSYGLENAWG